MKKLHLAPYCFTFALGNCFLPYLLGQVVHWVQAYVNQGLAGNQELAGATMAALAMPRWFYFFTALGVLAGAGVFIRKVSVGQLVHLLLAACILECLALSFFAFGIGFLFAPLC